MNLYSRDMQILMKAEKVCRSCKTLSHRIAARKYLILACDQLHNKLECLKLVGMSFYKVMNHDC